ncbi:hypothetical protein D3C76_1539360 [compost metagenome]
MLITTSNEPSNSSPQMANTLTTSDTATTLPASAGPTARAELYDNDESARAEAMNGRGTDSA